MHNLFRLASRAASKGSSTSRAPTASCSPQYANGLIATTGCPSGEIQTWLRIGDYEKARASAAEFRDIFGKDNFFLELMDHGLDIETRVRDGPAAAGQATSSLPMIATNDLHYTHADDADAHEVLLCVQSGKTMADPNRFKFDGARLLPQVPGRDALAVGRQVRPARGLRQHAADRRALRASSSPRATAPTCRASRCPTGETEQTWFVKEVARACSAASPTASRPRCRSRPTTRSASSSR